MKFNEAQKNHEIDTTHCKYCGAELTKNEIRNQYCDHCDSSIGPKSANRGSNYPLKNGDFPEKG